MGDVTNIDELVAKIRRWIEEKEIPPGEGHQFGGWNPQLGDGRAILLGEVIAADGIRHDIQLKGSGRTPYSRNGDGRAPLGPVLREYIVSEAMASLDIPTTRSLAAVTTGDPVYGEAALSGAVLARVSQSHIRIGTFQFFASKQDAEALQMLVAHVIARHYPGLAAADNPAQALLQEVVGQQAQLVAHWQLVGFIHGVMNTDNMLLSGETIDYGPCAFMDDFNPDTVYSSIDHGGRYAYRNQPRIAHWNLVCLAQTLLPLLQVKLAGTFPSESRSVLSNIRLIGRALEPRSHSFPAGLQDPDCCRQRESEANGE